MIQLWAMINNEYKYSELTSKIIGCSMKVHSALGNGFQEVIYQRALVIEMVDSGLVFSREHEIQTKSSSNPKIK